MNLTTIGFLSAIFAIIFVILKNIWDKKKACWDSHIRNTVNLIPGPPTVPLIGCVSFIGTPEYAWNKFREAAKIYPRLYRVWGGNQVFVVTQDAEDAEILLSNTKNLQKSWAYDLIKPWMGTGLLTSFGTKWKIRRRILTPAFHFNILKNFVSVFEKQSLLTVKELNAECNKPESDVMPFVIDHTLNSLCETAMGTTLDRNNTKMKSYKTAISNFGECFQQRLFHPWLYDNTIFFLMPLGRFTKKVLQTLHKFTGDVITERLNTWDETKGSQMSGDTASGKKVLPMLDLLIAQMKATGEIDYSGICEEVDTFMFEGHDTTSMTLSFLLMVLANNPHIQDKVLAEQKQILGDSKRQSSYDELQKMEYLDLCVKEGLRLYPGVPAIARQLESEIKLNEYVVPAGVQAAIMIYDLHRNPKYWPNPDKFDPDRFLPENCVNRHPFAYIPFSAGSRNCIGQKFAVLEIKSFISNVIRSFVLEPVDTPETIEIKMDLVLRPSNGIKVKFRHRV